MWKTKTLLAYCLLLIQKQSECCSCFCGTQNPRILMRGQPLLPNLAVNDILLDKLLDPPSPCNPLGCGTPILNDNCCGNCRTITPIGDLALPCPGPIGFTTPACGCTCGGNVCTYGGNGCSCGGRCGGGVCTCGGRCGGNVCTCGGRCGGNVCTCGGRCGENGCTCGGRCGGNVCTCGGGAGCTCGGRCAGLGCGNVGCSCGGLGIVKTIGDCTCGGLGAIRNLVGSTCGVPCDSQCGVNRKCGFGLGNLLSGNLRLPFLSGTLNI